MIKQINDILEKTYNNPILRQTTIPLLMLGPGLGKTSTVEKFVEKFVTPNGNKMVTMVLPNLMPNECVGGVYPNQKTRVWEMFDAEKLTCLNDNDVLFLDEVFNGTLPATLNAMLNLLGQRILPSGKLLPKILIVAASNPQGLLNLSAQIKERFIRYDLKFNPEEFQEYLKDKYGMPTNISTHLSTLVNKEKFDSETWNYFSPRSIEKSINQIGVDLSSPLEEVLIPYLSKEIISPVDINSLGIKQNDSIPYLTLLKHIIKEMNKSKQK